MSVNERCKLCGFTHHFFNQAGSCRAFGVKTYAEKEIKALKAFQSGVWISIEHAPKDREIDLWVKHADHPDGFRCPAAGWNGGWRWHDGDLIEEDGDLRVTHFMEIPAGPGKQEDRT